MKKYLILFLCIIITSSHAGPPARNLNKEKMIYNFDKWLIKNGYTEFLEVNENYKDECNNCNDAPSWSKSCFDKFGKPKKQCVINEDTIYYDIGYRWIQKYKNKLDIKIYTDRGSEIPNKARPNYDTLLFYAYNYLEDYKYNKKFLISPSKSPYKFESNLIDDKDVKKEITRKKSPLLSYLLFEEDKIIVDEITPKDKFGIVFQNDTQWVSHSVGKSFVSYIAGHAICGGYIDSVDSQLNDWDVIKNTLYEDQKLIDILNMSSGDQNHVTERDGLKKYRRWFNSHTIKSFAENELRGTKKSTKKYNYHGLNTNIIFNYVIHKTGNDFRNLIDDIFHNKIKIGDFAWFVYTNEGGNPTNDARYTFFLTRYDYLRTAKAIMDDWQNDTCVGKYLKTLDKRKINKNEKKYERNNGIYNATKSYGGQFHFNMIGAKDRNILGMDGYGGQQIVIDLDNSKIIVINSIHKGYNWNKIVYKKIK